LQIEYPGTISKCIDRKLTDCCKETQQKLKYGAFLKTNWKVTPDPSILFNEGRMMSSFDASV